MRITKDADNYEYRSCWDDDFNIEYAKPGCYVGFSHCHHDICHNDTTICVCQVLGGFHIFVVNYQNDSIFYVPFAFY